MKKWKKLKLRIVKYNKNLKNKKYLRIKKLKLYNLLKINCYKLLFDYYLT